MFRKLNYLLPGLALVSGLAMAENITEQLTFNYSGTVVISPCTIETPSLTIDFGDIKASDMATSGASTDWKQTIISLTGCADVSQVMMTVQYATAPANTYYMASTGTAKHVAIDFGETLFFDDHITNNTIITLTPDASGKVNDGFHFRIINDGTGAATPGTVIGTLTLTYEFK